MTREPAADHVATIEPALLARLHETAREPVHDWAPDPPLAELACHPDLVARLAEIARPVGKTRRVFVAGCPVITHPNGIAIAAASGTSWLAVRSGLPAGDLASAWQAPGLDASWVALQPWAPDIAFAKATDLLRNHLARAYEWATA